MEEASSAQQGPFYVTNVLEINHEDLKVRANVALPSIPDFICSASLLLLFSSFFLFASNFLPNSKNSCSLGLN